MYRIQPILNIKLFMNNSYEKLNIMNFHLSNVDKIKVDKIKVDKIKVDKIKVDNIDNIDNIIRNSFKYIKLNIHKNCLIYKNLSHNFKKFIEKKNTYFNSSSSSIIKHPTITDSFLMNIRYVNYTLDVNGRSNIGNNNGITINRICVLDKFFNIIHSIYLYPENYNIKFSGIEDIRLFNLNNEIYFIGSSYNEKIDKIQIVSNKYKLHDTNYSPLFITPNFKTNFNWEKNWVFFENNSKPLIIYKWYPIYICEINYENQKLNLIKTIQNLPIIFNNFRGSTNGVIYNNKIWFIVHQQNNIDNDIKSYVHNFVVFDNNMNLLGYSESFKFENKLVEYCIGMELTYRNNFVITYSTLDSTSKLIVFSPEYVNSLINYI